MEQDYKITVKSESQAANSENINLGTVYEQFGQKVIEYTSYDGESSYQTRITIGEDIISIVNNGGIQSVLNLEEGVTHSSYLQTEFGSVPVKVKLNQVMKDIKENSIYLTVDYEVSFSDYPQNFKIELYAEKIA